VPGPPGIFGYTCLGVSVTMTCPLQCAHCITESSPHVRDEMSVEEALGYLREARGVIDHVSFTGGEPLLKRARLETLVAEAKRAGYIVSVMTSGFWGKHRGHAFETLRRLKELGLDMLGVSLDRFHLEFIEEDRCINIAEVADELEIPVAVRVVIEKGDDYGDRVKQILSHTRADVHVNYLVKLGRASSFSDSSFNSCSHLPRETCETVTAADVVPGGDVYACCGPGAYMTRENPLLIGNAQQESLRTILERGLANPFMKVINTRGPYGLLADLRAHGQGDLVKTRARYTDACQLCLDICNNPQAVEALTSIYSEPQMARTQTAAQFLKLVGDYQSLQEARRRPSRWVRSVTRPGAGDPQGDGAPSGIRTRAPALKGP
jgi:pyruvate-formate lyase-activating enzyme